MTLTLYVVTQTNYNHLQKKQM